MSDHVKVRNEDMDEVETILAALLDDVEYGDNSIDGVPQWDKSDPDNWEAMAAQIRRIAELLQLEIE